MMFLRIQLLILYLSFDKLSEAQTAQFELQLCAPTLKGSACDISCVTPDPSKTIEISLNGRVTASCDPTGSCTGNTTQPSSTITTYSIASLNITAHDGNWTCRYGSDEDTKTLTVIALPPMPDSTDITHSSGLTTNIQPTISQVVDLSVLIGCTYPEPTTFWIFSGCSTMFDTLMAGIRMDEDTSASTSCEFPEKKYIGTTYLQYQENLDGVCIFPRVEIRVNFYPVGVVNADFNITFTDVGACNSIPCQNGGTCTPSTDDYECSCPIGSYGRNCETATAVSWCHPDTGSSGSRTRCTKIPAFDNYQTSTCMSVSEMQSTAPHVQCADSCRSYCILSCMAEKYSSHSGEVSTDCICDPGETTDAATGIPSWCFRTQGDCSFFYSCLQPKIGNCTFDISDNVQTMDLTIQCFWLSNALDDFSNCSTKEWLREVRICYQAFFVSSLDSEATTTCPELKDMVTSEAHDQCLRMTTVDNLDFCDLHDEDRARIVSTFFSSNSISLKNSINDTIAWMENC